MDDRFQSLMERAEADLDASSRAVLAEIVDGFMATHAGAPDFPGGERAHLHRVDTEPFEPADPQAVEALFARRG